jgi:hypothetical protein
MIIEITYLIRALIDSSFLELYEQFVAKAGLVVAAIDLTT